MMPLQKKGIRPIEGHLDGHGGHPSKEGHVGQVIELNSTDGSHH